MQRATELGVLDEKKAKALADRKLKGESQRAMMREFEPAVRSAEREYALRAEMRQAARARFDRYEQDRSVGLQKAYPKREAMSATLLVGAHAWLDLRAALELNGG